VGAAWVRLLPESDPGYGFVDAATPELCMGVVPAWRGRGVGSRLLQVLIEDARERGLTSLSLSVEPDNFARRLYERVGFRQVDEVSGSLTMLLGFRRPSWRGYPAARQAGRLADGQDRRGFDLEARSIPAATWAT